MEDKDNISVGERVIASTLWLGAWRWTARLLGMVSTIILARLLLPDDFGLVATGMIVITVFDILVDLGTDKYLIRLTDPDRVDYDTAWTLRLAVITVASASVFLLADTAAGYFEDERLIDILHVLAFASLLRGFNNIGLIMYRRDLEFRKIAYIGLTQRLVGTVVTISLAFYLKNYWAMIIGEIVLRITELGLSYVAHSYRPRLSISRFGKQWEFCKWIVVRNIASFMHSQGDNLIVAKYFGIELIGYYSMAMRLAAIPTSQLAAPMLAPVYSGLAKKQEIEENFRRSVSQVTGISCALVLPAAALFAVLDEALVLGLFGAKWQPVVPLVVPLVYSVASGVLINPAITTLTLMGRVKLLAVLHWISAVTIIALLLLVAQFGELEQFAWTRLVLSVLFVLVYYAFVSSALGAGWRDLLAAVYRPALASLIMATVVVTAVSSLQPWPAIMLGLPLGGLSYAFLLYGLWRLSGRPDSGEAQLVLKTVSIVRRKFFRPFT